MSRRSSAIMRCCMDYISSDINSIPKNSGQVTGQAKKKLLAYIDTQLLRLVITKPGKLVKLESRLRRLA